MVFCYINHTANVCAIGQSVGLSTLYVKSKWYFENSMLYQTHLEKFSHDSDREQHIKIVIPSQPTRYTSSRKCSTIYNKILKTISNTQVNAPTFHIE